MTKRLTPIHIREPFIRRRLIRWYRSSCQRHFLRSESLENTLVLRFYFLFLHKIHYSNV
jgi:hypothetical protein